jgi:hypothetical protein
MAQYIRCTRGPLLIGGTELISGEYMPFDSTDATHLAVQAEINAGTLAAAVVTATNPTPLAKPIDHTPGQRNW